MEAFNAGDVEGMWNMLSADQRERMTFENFQRVVKIPGNVGGRIIGTLELMEAIIKDVGERETTLVVRIVERWENREFEGVGEVKLRFEEGEWRIDTPVVVNPDPNEPIHALELEVGAEPIEVKVGGETTLNFTIHSRSPLPVNIYHAHTPARVILYKEEKSIPQFPQLILDVGIIKTLGPFGSVSYEEIIPSEYHLTRCRKLLTFSEPGIYILIPFVEFGVWRGPDDHRLHAQAIEIEVMG